MIEVRTSKPFQKQLLALPPQTIRQYRIRLTQWLANPYQPHLHWHKLKGQTPDVWSVNITGDIRALYIYEKPSTIKFIAIGTHAQLYGK